jgi:hypothetical protein
MQMNNRDDRRHQQLQQIERANALHWDNTNYTTPGAVLAAKMAALFGSLQDTLHRLNHPNSQHAPSERRNTATSCNCQTGTAVQERPGPHDSENISADSASAPKTQKLGKVGPQ